MVEFKHPMADALASFREDRSKVTGGESSVAFYVPPPAPPTEPRTRRVITPFVPKVKVGKVTMATPDEVCTPPEVEIKEAKRAASKGKGKK
jgi:hypothetical protein